jgi:hypothetical protein
MASPPWGTDGPFAEQMTQRSSRAIERRLDEINQLLWDFTCGRSHRTALEVFDEVHDFAFYESRLHHHGLGVAPELILDVVEAFADAASVAYAGQHGISSATLTLNYLGIVRQLVFEHPHLDVCDRWKHDVDRLAPSGADPHLTMDGLVVLLSYGGV